MDYVKRTLILFFSLVAIFILVACGQTEPSTELIVTPIGTISPAEANEDTVYVGVLAIRSAVAAAAQYQPILTYLAQELNRPFQLVALTQDSQFSDVEQGNLDFTFNNPLAAVQLRRLHETRFLATLSRVNTGPQFSGVIIVRPDSGISTYGDLKGQRGTCVNFETAAAGCVFQIFQLTQNGINPFTDFASFIETPSQDNIVLGVLNNTFDVGFIRTGQLEKMVNEGTLLSIDELTIFDPADDDFYFPHTTRLYPEWPMAALADTDPELATAVREALLALTPEHPAMINAGATGFVPAVDYRPIDELIVQLQLPSWDVAEN